jgi:hypothetical protein
MSKNMTRKGLAFGAGLSLVVSGFAALPAQANGLTGLIDLSPTSGPSNALAITAGAGKDFSLTASPAATVGSSGVLKFLVNDPEGKFNPVIGGLLDDGSAIEYPNSTANLTDTDDTETIAVSSAGVVTITTTHGFTAGDRIEFSADVVNDSGATLLLDDTVYTVASVTGTTSFTLVEAAEAVTLALLTEETVATTNADPSIATITDGSGTDFSSPFGPGDVVKFSAAIANANGAVAAANTNFTLVAASDDNNLKFEVLQANKNRASAVLSAASTVTLVAAAADGVANAVTIRMVGDANADGQFVVSSGVSNGSAISLALAAKDGVSRTVTVQAWVDTFSNNLIGAAEYVSSPVTVTFVALADITATTTLTPPAAGDANLSATVTTSPLINLSEDGNTDLVEIVFTRQGSITKGITTNASQSAVTGVISGQITMAIAANNITEWVDANADGEGVETANGEWSDSAGILAVPDARAAAAIGAVSVTASKIASVTTTAAHNLRTGDKITYASADIAVMDETAATVTVTGATTFTYPLSETTAVTAASDSDETAGGYTIGAGVS